MRYFSRILNQKYDKIKNKEILQTMTQIVRWFEENFCVARKS